MIRLLNAGVDTLSVITTQNGASVVVSFNNDVSGVYSGTRQLTAITSATTTTIVSTPTSQADVDHINIRNTYAGSHTITVQFNNNGTLHTLVVVTLAQNETLEYTHAGGWHTIDATGAAKVGTAGWVIAAGKIGTLSNSLTFAGTDGTTMTFPGTSGTVVTLDATQELTSKTLNASVGKGTWTASGTWTLPALTLGGTVSGGGNQINNVIIGTSTPLAGAFTTLTSSGVLSVTDATDATSATAASLKTAGGIASVKGLWIGTTSRLVGNVQTDADVGVGVSLGVRLDISDSDTTPLMLRLSSSVTDATTKQAKIGFRHYTAAEEDVMLLYLISDATTNRVLFGGGASSQNALTRFSILAAATTTTVTGTEVVRVTSTGMRVGGATDPTVALDVTGAALISTTLGVTGVISGTVNLNLTEMTAPTGIANKAVIYAEDNGAGKTKLMCKLGDDVAIQIAIQA